MANLKFYRGIHSSVTTKLAAQEFPAGSIVFVTDEPIFYLIKDDLTSEKFDGNGFDVDSIRVVESIELGADGHSLKVSYTGEASPQMETLTFNLASSTADGLMSKEDKAKLDGLDASASGTYNSNLDTTVSTVEDFGGVVAGTTVAQLNGKTYDELFDTLIFPTVYPTFTAPSATIALKSYSATQEIGAAAPTAANFTTGFDAGAITLAGVKQNDRAGALDADNSKILFSSSKVETLPTTVASGANTYYYRAAYAAGPQPLDSKGNNYNIPLAAGSVDSSSVTVNGYRPAYYGLVSTDTITASVVTGLTKNVSAKKTIKVSGPINEQYICFAAPAGWSVSNIKDSNNFDVTGTYGTQTVAVECLDGVSVDYTVYLSGKMTQPSTYYVNFN